MYFVLRGKNYKSFNLIIILHSMSVNQYLKNKGRQKKKKAFYKKPYSRKKKFAT